MTFICLLSDMRIDLREFLGGKYVRFQAFSKNTGLFLHGQRNIFVVSDKKGWSHDRGVSM
jgi:hypothetical protein